MFILPELCSWHWFVFHFGTKKWHALLAIERDPATIEMTVGTEVRLQPHKEDGSPDRAISGTPEENASRLLAFANVSRLHLIVALNAVTPTSIKQLRHTAELTRQL